MRYRIEYTDGGRCDFTNNRQEMVSRIKMAAPGTIADIRKLYKNGMSDSVIEKYEHICRKRPCQSGNSSRGQ